MTTLREQVQATSKTALADLEDLRRYWLDTQTAWEIVNEAATPGEGYATEFFGGVRFSSTPERRQELSTRADNYLQRYLAAAVVQQLYALFDGYLLGLIRLWLLAHPRHLVRTGRGQQTRQVSLAAVVNAPNRAAVLDTIVEREVRDVAYLSLHEQLDTLRKLVALGRPDDAERDQLAEFKATRDLLVHNDGAVNADYLAKAGPHARFAEGERMQLPDVYLTASFDLVRRLITEMTAAAVAKAGAAPARG